MIIITIIIIIIIITTIPPVDVKIRGVEVPCSMTKTLLEYSRFFAFP